MTATVRDLRASDAPRLLEFLRVDFPEEEALLGARPDGFVRVVKRVFRWDTRIVLGLMRLVGRPLFRYFVIEEANRIVATTLLTFTARAGYISSVVVDRAHRRRGYARILLERSREATRRRGLPFLVLDVLADNAPARALYESEGYRPLRRTSYYVHDRPDAPARAPPPAGLRPFRADDAASVADVARRGRPPEVERVLPTSARDYAGSSFVTAVLASESASWVIDPGTGPKAWVHANVSPATEAAHLGNPVVDPSVDAEAARALVATALAWCFARRAPRVLGMVPAENVRGRAALESAGFRETIPVFTLVKTLE